MQAYYGTTISGFPNFYLVPGPNIGGGQLARLHARAADPLRGGRFGRCAIAARASWTYAPRSRRGTTTASSADSKAPCGLRAATPGTRQTRQTHRPLSRPHCAFFPRDPPLRRRELRFRHRRHESSERRRRGRRHCGSISVTVPSSAGGGPASGSRIGAGDPRSGTSARPASRSSSERRFTLLACFIRVLRFLSQPGDTAPPAPKCSTRRVGHDRREVERLPERESRRRGAEVVLCAGADAVDLAGRTPPR